MSFEDDHFRNTILGLEIDFNLYSSTAGQKFVKDSTLRTKWLSCPLTSLYVGY